MCGGRAWSATASGGSDGLLLRRFPLLEDIRVVRRSFCLLLPLCRRLHFVRSSRSASIVPSEELVSHGGVVDAFLSSDFASGSRFLEASEWRLLEHFGCKVVWRRSLQLCCVRTAVVSRRFFYSLCFYGRLRGSLESCSPFISLSGVFLALLRTSGPRQLVTEVGVCCWGCERLVSFEQVTGLVDGLSWLGNLSLLALLRSCFGLLFESLIFCFCSYSFLVL